jgi:hypothetical protein
VDGTREDAFQELRDRINGSLSELVRVQFTDLLQVENTARAGFDSGNPHWIWPQYLLEDGFGEFSRWMRVSQSV